MPREVDTYRSNLERLCERFPDKEMLQINEVCEFLGMGYRKTINRFPFFETRISKATLARYMSPPYPK